jgi:hypothetical protein
LEPLLNPLRLTTVSVLTRAVPPFSSYCNDILCSNNLDKEILLWGNTYDANFPSRDIPTIGDIETAPNATVPFITPHLEINLPSLTVPTKLYIYKRFPFNLSPSGCSDYTSIINTNFTIDIFLNVPFPYKPSYRDYINPALGVYWGLYNRYFPNVCPCDYTVTTPNLIDDGTKNRHKFSYGFLIPEIRCNNGHILVQKQVIKISNSSANNIIQTDVLSFTRDISVNTNNTDICT